MKTRARLLTTTIAVAAMTLTAVAQPPERERGPRDRGPGGPGRPGGPPPEMMMRMMPVLAALDADKDGKISSEEIENATAALKKLDKNNDGQLTIEELRPDVPPMRGRPGAEGRPNRPEGDAGARGRGAEAFARMFETRDANKDGKLSDDEIPDQLKERMARLDTDKDGSISKEELQRSIAARARAGQRNRNADGDRPDGDRPEGDRPRRQRDRAEGDRPAGDQADKDE